MKKLLTLLSIMIVTGATATNVVSCSSSTNIYDKKNSDGDSIFYFLPKSTDNNSVNYATSNAWKDLNIENDSDLTKVPGSVKLQITQNLMKIFNVSSLASIADGTTKPTNDYENIADLSNIQSIFKNNWTNLQSEVEQTFKDQKNNQGKNWDSWLKDNYDGDENNYKAYLYSEGGDSDSASSVLAQTLSDNYQANYDGVSGDNILEYLENKTDGLIPYYNENNNLDSWGNSLKKMQIVIAIFHETNLNNIDSDFDNLVDALDTATSNKGSSIENYKDLLNYYNTDTSSPKEYKLYSIANDASNIAPNSSSSDDPINNINYNYSNIQNDNLNGLFSPSQLFLENKWYQAEKPLAVSQILIKYSAESGTAFDYTSNKLEDYTTNEKINQLFNSKSQESINKIIDYLNDDSSKKISSIKSIASSNDNINKPETKWDQLMQWVPSYNDSNLSNEYESNLLTVNASEDTSTGFANDMFKSSIYGSLLQKDSDDDALITSSEASSIPVSLSGDSGLIKELEQKDGINSEKDNDMYKIYKAGDSNIIVYFDSLGMHLVHIDGSSNNTNTSNPNYLNTSSGTQYDYIKNYTKTDQLNNIQKYNNYINQRDPNNENSNFNLYTEDTSTGTTNHTYLDFLNAMQFGSITTNLDLKNEYKYDIKSELTAFATFDATQSTISSDSATMWFWNFDYIKWYLSGPDDTENSDWISSILNFNNKNIETIFNNELDIFDISMSGLYETNFESSVNSINTSRKTNPNGSQGAIDMSQLTENDDWNNLWNQSYWNIEL